MLHIRVSVLVIGLLAAGCAGVPGRQTQPLELFAAPPPPPLAAPSPAWAASLAGLALGLGLGLLAAHLWRRRLIDQAIDNPGSASPADLSRLQAILRLMDELALGWRRREKIRRLPRRDRPPRL